MKKLGRRIHDLNIPVQHPLTFGDNSITGFRTSKEETANENWFNPEQISLLLTGE